MSFISIGEERSGGDVKIVVNVHELPTNPTPEMVPKDMFQVSTYPRADNDHMGPKVSSIKVDLLEQE